jgi:hypothetical protein
MTQSASKKNKLTTPLPGSTRAQAVPFFQLMDNNTDTAYDNDGKPDTRPRTKIFTSNAQINATMEDRLSSYDQTEIFKYRPVDVVIIGEFNRTQIRNRPSYINALLIQSRGIDAENVSKVQLYELNKFTDLYDSLAQTAKKERTNLMYVVRRQDSSVRVAVVASGEIMEVGVRCTTRTRTKSIWTKKGKIVHELRK